MFWKWQTLASALLTIIGHILLMIVPESPRYLVSKGKLDEACRSLCWLKNTTDADVVQAELKEVSFEIPATIKLSKKCLFK